jgi:hypothetical protein
MLPLMDVFSLRACTTRSRKRACITGKYFCESLFLMYLPVLSHITHMWSYVCVRQRQEESRRQDEEEDRRSDDDRPSRREDSDSEGEDCCHKPKAHIPRLLPFVERRAYLERRRRERGEEAPQARPSEDVPQDDGGDDDDAQDDDEEDETPYVSAVHRLSASYDERVRQGAVISDPMQVHSPVVPVAPISSKPRVWKDPEAVAQSVRT